MKKSTVFFGAAACLAGLMAEAAPTAYENDFTTRTGGVPAETDWDTSSYVLGQVARYYTDKTLSDITSVPWSEPQLTQDGWFLAHYTDAPITVCAVANKSDNVENEGSDNPYLRFGCSSWAAAKLALAQPFYNSFTDGVLRIYADLRAPTNWPGNGYIRIQPICEDGFKTLDWTSGSLNRSLANWGLQCRTGNNSASMAMSLYSGDGKGGSQAIRSAWTTNRHWYRFVVDMDLVAGTYSGFVYDQGETHPNLADANGSLTLTIPTSKNNYTLANAAAGPVSGLAVVLTTFKTSSGDRYTDPLCDNLACEWKAPGASAFARFYENDFSTRRRRRVCPAPQATYDYVRTESVTTSTSNPYSGVTASTTTNGVYNLLSWDQESYPMGIGAWRRANWGKDNVVITKYDGNAMMRISYANQNGDRYACVTQTLGEEITTGKVRLSFDFRTCDKWRWDYRGIYGVLGPAQLWGASNAIFSASCGARIGCSGNSATAFNAYTSNASGGVVDTSVTLQPDTWYRGVLTVDVDKKTSTGELYLIGSSPVASTWQPTESPVYTSGPNALRTGVTSIGAFCLSCYGAGVVDKTATRPDNQMVFFDNVFVWKDWDDASSTGSLVFKDIFNSQQRTFAAQARGTLIGTSNLDDGQDHWIRRNVCYENAWITSAENPSVAACGGNGYSYAVQDLGARYRNGRVVCQADIRPPCGWNWETVRAGTVIVGGDIFKQGELGTANGRLFTSAMYGYFGFGNSSNVRDSMGVYSGTGLKFYDGDGQGGGSVVNVKASISSTHWYRFRAVFDLQSETYEVKVYDQGTAHPVATTEDGTLVHTQTGLHFRHAVESGVGISSVSLATYGNSAYLTYDPEDPGLVLYDNLKVWKKQDGLSIIVR